MRNLSSYFLAPEGNNHKEGTHLMYFPAFLSMKLLLSIICAVVTNVATYVSAWELIFFLSGPSFQIKHSSVLQRVVVLDPIQLHLKSN